MTPEQRATKSVDYLLRVDALASHDYRPEIEAEIVRAIRDALKEARVVDLSGPLDSVAQ